MSDSQEATPAPVGTVTTDASGRVLSANLFMLQSILGMDEKDVIGQEFQGLLHPTSRLFFKLQLDQVLRLSGSFREAAVQVVAGNATSVDVLVNATRRGQQTTYALFPAPARKQRDLELREAREEAEIRNRLLSQIERMASIGAWTLEDDLKTLSFSDEVFRICELPGGEAPDLSAALEFFVSWPDDVMVQHLRLALLSSGPVKYEGEFRTFAGNRRRVRATAEVEHLPGGRRRLVGILQDVTKDFETERQLQQLALYDPLTGLANRAQFQIRLDELIAAARKGVEASLLLLDLDGFKEINDTFGHDAGDDLLVQISNRIRSTASDLFCARLGGDEFAIFHTAEASQSLNQLSEALLDKLHEPVVIAGIARSISVSIGIKSFVGDGVTPGKVYKRADLALYQAKTQGRDRSVRFEPAFEASLERKHNHVQLVQEAARLGQIRPFLQPIVSARDGAIVGFEALARIVRPGNEVLSPGQFYEALSDPVCSELVHQAVVGGILDTLAAWKEQGITGKRISFNLAETVLRSQGFPLSFMNQVAAKSVSPQEITIEIQETVFLGRDTAVIKNKLQALRDAGFCVALDDFGTGFASLSHLVDFPVDCIKIDQSFVIDLEQRPDKQAVARAIIGLGRSLQLSVIAEGVETRKQAGFLDSHGCNYLQGYLYGKAMPPDVAAEAMLSQTFFVMVAN